VDEAHHFQDSSQEDLKLLTLGTYQLELAREYANQHLKKRRHHMKYTIQLGNEY
jgi:uncharacterized cupin superfamily protein